MGIDHSKNLRLVKEGKIETVIKEVLKYIKNLLSPYVTFFLKDKNMLKIWNLINDILEGKEELELQASFTKEDLEEIYLELKKEGKKKDFLKFLEEELKFYEKQRDFNK
jgi:hypothetical protein